MAILVAIVLAIVGIVVWDHICYWRKLDEFEIRALEFSTMYKIIAPIVLHGDPEEPDVEEFMFVGEYFKLTIEKGDVKSFYAQMKIAICEVLDAYDNIGTRYLELMDDETSERIYQLHSNVVEIENIVRYQSWLNGVK